MNKNVVFAITLVIAVVVGSGFGYYLSRPDNQKQAAETVSEDISEQQAQKMVNLFAALDAENAANQEEQEVEEPSITEYEYLVNNEFGNIASFCDSQTFADQQLCYKQVARDYLVKMQKNASAVQYGNPQFPREFLVHLRHIINDPTTEFGSCIHKYQDQKITDKEFALCTIVIHHRVEMNIRAYQNNIWHDGL